MREAAVAMAALNGAQGGKVYGSLLLNSHPVLEENRPNRIVDEVRQARWEDKRRKRRQKQTKKKKKSGDNAWLGGVNLMLATLV